ncbi:MAG TPA: cytochrome c [Vicinamibacterales bacterium]|jgi:mono/diheme cytochrome c family protein|nr:cytochrome c [Vicinamibacterales bacterium]
MKLRVLFGVLAVIWLAGVTQFSARAEQAAAAPGASKTVWDGVFTQEQADRGAGAFKTACSECHGNDLAGDGFAPALTGSDFMGNWNELSVGDLYERIRISMPPSGPSAVTPAQKADIVAYIMNVNKFPAGTTELEPKTEVLKGIKIEMKK